MQNAVGTCVKAYTVLPPEDPASKEDITDVSKTDVQLCKERLQCTPAYSKMHIFLCCCTPTCLRDSAKASQNESANVSVNLGYIKSCCRRGVNAKVDSRMDNTEGL